MVHRRTISTQRSLMVDVIAHHSLRLVQEESRLFRIANVINQLLEKVGVVSACCLDEELLGGCTLFVQSVNVPSKAHMVDKK